MRRLHYSVHTERAYCDWVKRYVKYHGMAERGEGVGVARRVPVAGRGQ